METVTLRGVTYAVTRETDPTDDDITPARMLGWLTGSRGTSAMIVRLQPSGVVMLMAETNTALFKVPTREANAALAPLFT